MDAQSVMNMIFGLVVIKMRLSTEEFEYQKRKCTVVHSGIEWINNYIQEPDYSVGLDGYQAWYTADMRLTIQGKESQHMTLADLQNFIKSMFEKDDIFEIGKKRSCEVVIGSVNIDGHRVEVKFRINGFDEIQDSEDCENEDDIHDKSRKK